tara:strand:- start:706 stop:1329 length:624 start_codon:yes stop_codon:yes gene_type:complete
MKQEKNTILDPLTCIIRLAILSFKPVGTKISISNHRISYCEPSIFQGTLRLAFGDNREDLHNIYNPLRKAISWFKNSDRDMHNLFKYAGNGIKVLRESYSRNSTIHHTLKLYQDIIKHKHKEQPDTEDESEKHKTQELNKIYLRLKNLWNERELSIVNNLIIELKHKIRSKNDQNEIDAIFDALELILNVKENMVSKIIVQETTILN